MAIIENCTENGQWPAAILSSEVSVILSVKTFVKKIYTRYVNKTSLLMTTGYVIRVRHGAWGYEYETRESLGTGLCYVSLPLPISVLTPELCNSGARGDGNLH